MRKKNTAEVLVECLENHGVNYVFGVPGEENLAFLEALRKSKIIFVTTRHEQAAAFMAATIGRMTGKIGVALSTLGPGATNLLTSVAYAQLGGFPLLVITGQKPIKKSKQGKFQIVDMVAMMKPVTKYSATVTDGNKVPNMFAEAVSLAETERPGAVHLELPEDIAEESCDAIPLAPLVSFEIINSLAKDTEIRKALVEIEKAKHPIIVLGGGLNRHPLREELEAFFKKTSIPFISTQMGKGAMDETSPLYVGTTGIQGGDFVHLALKQADVIVLIGHDVINTPPIILDKKFTKNCKVIHINFFPSVAKDVYEPTHEVVGDISNTILVLTEKIKVNPKWDFSYFYEVRDVLKKDIIQSTQAKNFPLRPERVIGDISKVLGKEDMLALDNGMYKIYFSRSLPIQNQNGMLLDNALATMGAGLPSGIALKMLYPTRKVLVVVGDGGIMMSIGDLETAVRLKLDLVVLILDDSGYGMISWKQKKMNLADFGLSFSNPDFVKLAESFGATGHKISKAEDLEKILKQTLNAKGVHIVACPISYEKSNEILGKVKML